MQRDPIDLISDAFNTLAVLPGWETDFSSELECHPDSPALAFNDVKSDVGLSLCPRCLRVYLRLGRGLEATSADVIPEDRVCFCCGKTAPLADFFARTGLPTRFCSACRVKWDQEKKEAEAAKAVASAIEEADMKRTLAAVRKDLRRLEASLGSSE